MKKILESILITLLLISCKESPYEATRIDKKPIIYPDYAGVTIPAGIAPLNFCIMDPENPNQPYQIERCFIVIKGAMTDSIVCYGSNFTEINIDKWQNLTKKNIGDSLSVSTYIKREGQWFQYNDFKIYISRYPMEEYGLTYRKLAPGYVLCTDMGIFQRDLHTFEEKAIVKNTEIHGSCVGCHTSNRTAADQFSLHIRGKYGATLLRNNGIDQWLETKTDSTLSKCVYTSWHPSGNYIAYSLNQVHQKFWATQRHEIEVFDINSDIVVLNTEKNVLLRSTLLEGTKGWMESYPAFSATGDTLYFVRTPYKINPEEIKSTHYSLCSIAFDPQKGTFGDSIHTIINGDIENISISFPRPSYDGRWLVYTQHNYGCFSIQHDESDLYILDLKNGKRRGLSEINTKYAESFCNWNGNSHWLVFASRRDDGLYTRLYLTCINEKGIASKPVLLPQLNPWNYYHELLMSYNTPDWIDAPVKLDVHDAFDKVASNHRIALKLK